MPWVASRRAGRGAAFIVSFVAASAATLVASCSLGLDESLLGVVPEGGVDEPALDDGAVVETGGEDAPETVDAATPPCSVDSDCQGTAGCFEARCDVPRKTCVRQVCRAAACSSATCDVAASTCGTAKTYHYRAAQFGVGAPLACGGAPGRCLAAVYPFVFVGTANGVVAFSARDPQSTAPPSVPLVGLGFVPTQIVASGSRVFFLGAASGSGTTSRVPLAFADVPSDPFAPKIVVTTVLATYPRIAGEPLSLFPRTGGTALLVDLNAADAYAATAVEPPLVEPLTLPSQGITFTAGSFPIATSGSRLLMHQTSTVGVPSFGLVSGAGSSAPTTAPDVVFATATPTTSPESFAPSPEGAVFWAYVALSSAPPGPPVPTIRAARGYFLTKDGSSALDTTAGLDLEVYAAAPQGTPSVGPVAMIDAATALVVTSVPTSTQQSNVGFVTRSPLALLKNADNTPRRTTIALPVSQLSAAGSNGIGYVLAVDPLTPTTPTVYVFDPACAP